METNEITMLGNNSFHEILSYYHLELICMFLCSLIILENEFLQMGNSILHMFTLLNYEIIRISIPNIKLSKTR